MERHVQNAAAVAAWLEARHEVTWVAYPGLASSPWHDRQQRYLPKWRWRHPGLRDRGRRRRRPPVHRGTRALQPPGQRGRRPQPGHPPGVDHPLAADRGRAGLHRRDARPGAPLHRHRVGRGHPGRPRARASPPPRGRDGRPTDRSLAARRRARRTQVRPAGLDDTVGLPTRARRHAARGHRGLRDVGVTGRVAGQRRARPPCPDRRLPCRRARRAGPPDAPDGGTR